MLTVYTDKNGIFYKKHFGYGKDTMLICPYQHELIYNTTYQLSNKPCTIHCHLIEIKKDTVLFCNANAAKLEQHST